MKTLSGSVGGIAPRVSGFRRNPWVLALGALAASLLTGCPNPNTYGTPRTVAPGKVSHSIAMEWVGWRFEARQIDESGEPVAGEPAITESGSIIVPPTYMLRVGVADQVDLGVRFSNLTSVGADVKVNFLRGEVLDLALDPGAQWMFVGFNVYHLHLPLLVGVNLSEAVSVVLTPGIMYGINTYSTGNSSLDNELNRLLTADGLYGRAGLGINLRLSRHFAIHPEISFLRSFRGDPEDSPIVGAMSYLFGVGFNFGSLPEHGSERSE